MRVLLAALCLVAGLTAGCARRSADRGVDRGRAVTSQDIVGSCQATAELLVAKVNKRAGPDMENTVVRAPTRVATAWVLDGVMVTRQDGTVQTRDEYRCIFTGTTIATADASVSRTKHAPP